MEKFILLRDYMHLKRGDLPWTIDSVKSEMEL